MARGQAVNGRWHNQNWPACRHDHLAGVSRSVGAGTKPFQIAADNDEVRRPGLSRQHLDRQVDGRTPFRRQPLNPWMLPEALFGSLQVGADLLFFRDHHLPNQGRLPRSRPRVEGAPPRLRRRSGPPRSGARERRRDRDARRRKRRQPRRAPTRMHSSWATPFWARSRHAPQAQHTLYRFKIMKLTCLIRVAVSQ